MITNAVCPTCNSHDVYGVQTADRIVAFLNGKWTVVENWTVVDQEKTQFHCGNCGDEWEDYLGV